MLNHFSRAEAAKILGMKPSRLRYWDKIGLVRPSLREKSRAFYDFQDMLCLRTAQGLVDKGLAPSKIKDNIHSLRKKLPRLDEQLNTTRIYVFGNRVLISRKNRLIDSHADQLLFKFDVDEFSQQVYRDLEAAPVRTAEEWFKEGQRQERKKETRDDALNSYQEAVKLDAEQKDAYVRMGVLFYQDGKLIDAQRCFRLALKRDPYDSRAAYNLGNVLDELNCSAESLTWYERAIEVDPKFADAYFNLAAASEKVGQFDRAIKCWRAYLRFDSESSHAATARQRIEILQTHLAANT